MRLGEVVEILEGLESVGVTVWLDGGWCVDALVGRQLREHSDLDVAVDRKDEEGLRGWLTARGFAHRQDPAGVPWNYVFADEAGDAVDVHVFSFGEDGHHAYGIEYSAGALTGSGSLGNTAVRCIAPEWMFRFKTAYPPAPKDIEDVHALACKFRYSVPPSHQRG